MERNTTCNSYLVYGHITYPLVQPQCEGLDSFKSKDHKIIYVPEITLFQPTCETLGPTEGLNTVLTPSLDSPQTPASFAQLDRNIENPRCLSNVISF